VTALQPKAGLLLPIETLALLGAGEQGVSAIRAYGLTARDFDVQFAELVERLDKSDDVEAALEASASMAIAAASRRGHAWISVRSEDASVAPAIAVVGSDVAIVAVVHGPVAEYVIDEPMIIANAVRGALAAAPESELYLTLFVGDDPFAGARFRDGTVDLSAKDPQSLEQFALAARAGLDALIGAFNKAN